MSHTLYKIAADVAERQAQERARKVHGTEDEDFSSSEFDLDLIENEGVPIPDPKLQSSYTEAFQEETAPAILASILDHEAIRHVDFDVLSAIIDEYPETLRLEEWITGDTMLIILLWCLLIRSHGPETVRH